ncbi:MAG: histone deacetylase [Armatimonadota bacterium]|nr:histone deacetylase [Armatimonadota bacterium]
MTGLVYDEVFLEHGVEHHPESAERLEVCMQRLRETGLLDEMRRLPTRPAEIEELCWIHSEQYVMEVRDLSRAGGGDLDLDTRATEMTWDAARLAAGGCIDAARAVHAREADNALCLVRPPGHHARPGRGMGFCFFNNLAIAAQALIRDGATSVAIVDFDGHHGNGTHEAFYHREDVLYISLHQTPLFPGTGSIGEIGVEAGFGRTMNLPFPPHAQDIHHLRAFDEVVMPALAAYQPDAILVSAGFDPHFRDPLVQLSLTARGFFLMTVGLLTAARDLCDGRLTCVLEGGYDLQIGLPESVEATARALMRKPEAQWHQLDPPPHPEQTRRVDEAVDEVIRQHKERQQAPNA